jgi:hypothetical protein
MFNIMKKISILSLSFVISSALCSAKTNYEELITFYENPLEIDSIKYDFSIAGNNFSFDHGFDFGFEWVEDMDKVQLEYCGIKEKLDTVMNDALGSDDFNVALKQGAQIALENEAYANNVYFKKLMKTLFKNKTDINTIRSGYEDIKKNIDITIAAAQESSADSKKIILDGIMQVSETLNQKHNISLLGILNRSKTIRHLIAERAKKENEQAIHLKHYEHHEFYEQFKADREARIKAVSNQ